MKSLTQSLKNIEFTISAQYGFVISLIFGSLIFFAFVFTQSLTIAIFGFLYVIALSIINLLLLIDELFQSFTNKELKKIHFNSALLITLNIPIALLYYFILIIFNF